MKKNRTVTRCFLLGLISCSVGLVDTARAIPITGEIDFEGVVTADNSDLTLATHFTFNSVTVGVSVGNYAGLNGSSVAQSGITFRPVPVAPVANFWSITQGGVTYSFDLSTFGITALTGTHFLGLSGVGTAHETGFDDTAATWSLAATTQGGNVFTFSESTAAGGGIGTHGAVPDSQSTAGLFGAGLCALGLFRRKLGFAI